MKVLKIEIELENQAFDNSPTGEIGRILRSYSDTLEKGLCHTILGGTDYLRDINGNKVGKAWIAKED